MHQRLSAGQTCNIDSLLGAGHILCICFKDFDIVLQCLLRSGRGEAFISCKLALIMTGVRASHIRTWFLIAHIFIFPPWLRVLHAKTSKLSGRCRRVSGGWWERTSKQQKQKRRGRENERPRLSFARLTIALPDDPADDEPKRLKWRRHQEDGYLHKKCRRCRRKRRRQEMKWSLNFKGLQRSRACDH